jgi:chemotaxis protein histidine kinase CheA
MDTEYVNIRGTIYVFQSTLLDKLIKNNTYYKTQEKRCPLSKEERKAKKAHFKKLLRIHKNIRKIGKKTHKKQNREERNKRKLQKLEEKEKKIAKKEQKEAHKREVERRKEERKERELKKLQEKEKKKAKKEQKEAHKREVERRREQRKEKLSAKMLIKSQKETLDKIFSENKIQENLETIKQYINDDYTYDKFKKILHSLDVEQKYMDNNVSKDYIKEYSESILQMKIPNNKAKLEYPNKRQEMIEETSRIKEVLFKVYRRAYSICNYIHSKIFSFLFKVDRNNSTELFCNLLINSRTKSNSLDTTTNIYYYTETQFIHLGDIHPENYKFIEKCIKHPINLLFKESRDVEMVKYFIVNSENTSCFKFYYHRITAQKLDVFIQRCNLLKNKKDTALLDEKIDYYYDKYNEDYPETEGLDVEDYDYQAGPFEFSKKGVEKYLQDIQFMKCASP